MSELKQAGHVSVVRSRGGAPNARTLRGVLALAMGIAFSAISCGSKTSEQPAPTSGGTAGAAADCMLGDTRTCVGPSACRGGQACGANARWGACDCGEAGLGGQGVGGGGSAGSAGALVSIGGASGVGGESGIGGTSTEAGTGGGAGAGSLNAGDEPCPDSSILADCSGQCGAKPAACDMQCPVTVVLDHISDGMVIARTPSSSGGLCTICTPATRASAYSVSIVDQVAPPPATAFHVTVPAPWFAAIQRGYWCTTTEAACVPFGSDGVIVWTADPNAPAINITAAEGPCPVTP